jgi:predicted glutamine amidotransferase
MCRWLGYVGEPIRPEELLYQPERSLIEQSKKSNAPDASISNGDGFGLGWYGMADGPGLFRSESPAWGDRNLREISAQVCSPLFLAHVRAATGSAAVQQTNCHPFRYGPWMFVHNGFIGEFERLRRELLLAVDPEQFNAIEGTTDSELMFHLALTFGLAEDPLGGLERMAGFVEAAGRRIGVEYPLQMTVGVTDGLRLYAVRYASGPEVNTLFLTESARDVRLLYPEDERLQHFSDELRVVVSEPLVDLPGLWREVPAGTALVVQPGDARAVPFTPREP